VVLLFGQAGLSWTFVKIFRDPITRHNGIMAVALTLPFGKQCAACDTFSALVDEELHHLADAALTLRRGWHLRCGTSPQIHLLSG
jgi:hypothetical protein